MTAQQPDSTAREIKTVVSAGYRKIAPGWHRWRREFTTAGEEITRALVAAARPEPGMIVLDVGCGAGEAAYSVSSLVEPSGRVFGIDLVAEMLPRRQPQDDGGCWPRTASFCVADGEKLPFRPGGFDLVTCRMAIMHFPAPVRAAAEMLRVLRPGGRCVLTALGPMEDPSLVKILVDYGARAPTLPTLPDPHRFGAAGALASTLTRAGFEEVHEQALTCVARWPGSAEQFRQAMPEHGFYIAELIDSLAPGARPRAEAAMLALLRHLEVDGTVRLPVQAVIATGVRASR